MSIPVEVRMPYLDHKLIEFLTSIPAVFFKKWLYKVSSQALNDWKVTR